MLGLCWTYRAGPSMRPKQSSRLPELLPASLPGVHALFSPALVNAFETLVIGATLRDKNEWYALHSPPSVTGFEIAHGRGVARNDYNEGLITRVRNEGKILLGQHAGMFDYFVPIGSQGEPYAVLITGPFLTRRLNGAELLERWYSITGRHGHPSDPEFAHFVTMMLATLVLPGEQLQRYEQFLTCFAKLCAAEGDPRQLAAEAGRLRDQLEASRFVERSWREARTMVDERESGVWLSPHKATDLRTVGLAEIPEHVIVGLCVGSPDDPDVVGQIARRDGFQRASVDLARSRKNVLAGRVGEHGVSFLLSQAGSGSRARRVLTEVANDATALAKKKFGLRVCFGAGALSGTDPLPRRYQQALAQAERAVSEGIAFAEFSASAPHKGSALRQLRQELGATAMGRLEQLVPRFERYIEAVSMHAGYRLELVRAHLEAGFERIAEGFLGAGSVEARNYEELFQELEREASRASSVSELIAVYRRTVSALAKAAERPVQGAHDRNLRRAIAYIDANFTEPVRLPQVAKIAGFAPRYFSKLFKEHQRATFENYVRRLRVERAKQLLTGTDLSVERIAELSGFRLRPYFHRAFKQLTGETPDEFRSAAE
jgi:AraC-like DNA-binding protein